jgi:hypothetical protein
VNKNLKLYRFDVLIVVKILMLFWVVTLCGLVSGNQCFGETGENNN